MMYLKMVMKMTSEESKQHMIRNLSQGIRYDGRELKDYRDTEVETGVSSTAEGSARVKMGDTEVIVGVKLQVECPFPDRPDEGMLMVGAELSPLSHSDFELGPPSIEGIEVARVIDRGIRESGFVDVKQLVSKPGDKSWAVLVDIGPLNVDGSLFDAGFLGGVLALKDAKFPEYEDEQVDYKHKTDKGLPLSSVPVSVTVVRIGDQIIVDPIPDEEQLLDSRITVTVLEDGSLTALQKGGDSGLTIDTIDTMLTTAIEKAEFLRQYV